jgi:hypothetical protein
VRTAGKIREAQLAAAGEDNVATVVPDVVQLSLLVEQNFGSMEGKKFYEWPPEWKLSGKIYPRVETQGTVSFVEVESKDAMAQRADTFLDMHLLPLLDDTSGAAEKCIALVSHGIFLSTLWKRLLLRLPAKSVVFSPELQATARPSVEHLGGWSNTGFLELLMIRPEIHKCSSTKGADSSLALVPPSSPAETPVAEDGLGKVEAPPLRVNREVVEDATVRADVAVHDIRPRSHTHRNVQGWKTMILTINGKDHLRNLKRTGGGVGSSRYDSSQKTIETFFKRRKVE